MQAFKSKLQDTLSQVTIYCSPHPRFYLLVHSIMLLQTMSVILNPQSYLYKLVFWSEPSTYAGSYFGIALGSVCIFLVAGLLVVRMYLAKGKGLVLEAGTLTQYLSSFQGVINLITETVILTPFVRSSIQEMKNPSSSEISALSGIMLGVFLVFGYPTLLYTSFSCNSLSSPNRAHLRPFNIQLLLSIFRPFFAITNALGTVSSIACSAIFLPLCLSALIRTPVFGYGLIRFRRAVPAAVLAACLIRLCGVLSSDLRGSVFIELLSIAGFVALAELISTLRTKQVLSNPQPTVHQIKLLLCLASSLENSLGELEDFLLRHHRGCSDPRCCCGRVVEHLSSRQGDLANDKVWFEFLASFVLMTFDLTEISRLPQSQMYQQTEKYLQLVYDLSEVFLFKLERLSMAWRVLDDLRKHLETHGLEKFWSAHRSRVVEYHMQQAIEKRFRKAEGVNLPANAYLDFQLEFGRLFRLLLRAATRTERFWKELGDREPQQQVLRDDFQQLEQWHRKIRAFSRSLGARFPQAIGIIDTLVSDYCGLVLGASHNEPCHFASLSEESTSEKKERPQRLSEDAECFSQDSETPLCLVSTAAQNMGEIVRRNFFFEEAESLLGPVASVQELLPIQLRVAHAAAMLNLVEGDGLFSPHPYGFLLAAGQHLLGARLLVQSVPSIAEGLLFAVFLKRLNPEKRLFALQNNCSLSYRSKSFDSLLDTTLSENSLISALSSAKILSLSGQNSLKLRIENEDYTFHLLHTFKHLNTQLLFLEICCQEDCQYQKDVFYSKIGDTRGETNIQYRKRRENARSLEGRLSKFSMMKSECMKARKEEESSTNEVALQKLMKMDKSIKQTFGVVVSQTTGQSVRRKHTILFLVIGFLLILLLGIGIKLKIDSEQVYFDIWETNDQYHELLMTLGRTVKNLKLINLGLHQGNNVTSHYEEIIKEPNVMNLLDEMVSIFNIQDIQQEWTTLSLDSNATFQMSSESYFKAVPDYLQKPLINIQNEAIQDFNFSFALNYLKIPLSSPQIHFHTFITNALYFALPNLRNIYNPTLLLLISNFLKANLPLIIIFLLIALMSTIGSLVMFNSHRQIKNLSQYSHRLIQSLSPEVIKEKRERCETYLNRYSPKIKEEDKTQQTSPAQIMCHSQVFSSNISKQLSKTIDEVTSRQLNFPQNKIQVQKEEEIQGSTVALQRRKNEFIFSQTSCGCLFSLYILPTVPLYIFSLVFIIFQIYSPPSISLSFDNQRGSAYVIEELLFIEIYLMHFGIYDYSLEKYQSIAQIIAYKIYSMFSIIQIVLTTFESTLSNRSKAYFQKVIYGNICEFQQDGVFSTSTVQFEGKNDYAKCMSVSNQILTKGLVPAIIAYVETANKFFIANSKTIQYNQTQKLEYLSSSFFADTTRLFDYIQLVLTASDEGMHLDFTDKVEGQKYNLMITSVVLIVIIVILIFWLPKIYLKFLNKSIRSINSIFALISLQTIKSDQKLKEKFISKLDDLKLMK